MSRRTRADCSISERRSTPPAMAPLRWIRRRPIRRRIFARPSTRSWCSRTCRSLPPALEQALVRYVRGGGAVLVALGRAGGAGQARSGVRSGHQRDALCRAPRAIAFRRWRLPIPLIPRSAQSNKWDDVKFYQTVRIEPGKARIAARLTDDTPLLLEKQLGEGRVLVFASTFDNISNDFPLHASLRAVRGSDGTLPGTPG